MNRLHQLQETLLQNLSDTRDEIDIDFLILNYNSSDNMEEWCRHNLSEEILSGRVKYFKTTDPQSFSHSHSKNMVFKLAEGEIVCNINADHYIGERFPQLIRTVFSQNASCVLTPVDYHNTDSSHAVAKDVFGKVCLWKRDFLAVSGFDERMTNYGFEDWDLVNRLELIGVKRVLLKDPAFLRFIAHGEDERYGLKTEESTIFTHHYTPAESEIIYLHKNGRFEKGRIINNKAKGAEKYIYSYKRRTDKFQLSLRSGQWQKGSWFDSSPGLIELQNDSMPFTTKKYVKKRSELQESGAGKQFHQIDADEAVNQLVRFNYLSHNRFLLEANLKRKNIRPNGGKFGHAHVTYNFSKNGYPI